MITAEKWAEIIKDFHESELPKTIERNTDIPLDTPIKRAVSIIGPRRAGKTYEMYNLIGKIIKKSEKSRIVYVNFERPDIGIVNKEDLMTLLKTYYELYPENKKSPIWLFLDEIQNVSGWEQFVRYCLDSGVKVYITGSSSRLLSKEVATSMRGRSLTYKILPFSFNEYLRVKSIPYTNHPSTYEKARIVNALKDYLMNGGYPEAVLYEKEREKILSEIKDVAIYKDVIERSKIRNVTALKSLINALVQSREFSINKFYNFLKSTGRKIGKNVLYAYIQYLEDAFFAFMLRKFSYSYKEAEQSIPKPYFVDNGLLAVSGITDPARLLENLVFIELYRRNEDIAYAKMITKEEVDFIVKKGNKVKQLIQVAYNLSTPETKEREIKALIKAGRELKCGNLLIITFNEEGREKSKNKAINVVPAWKWLIER